ncbi:MAG: AMP phosphorylase [Methanosarcinaceae archaeon]|nr:AMP phosphorylase [Methanosarcinaceae archaeon]
MLLKVKKLDIDSGEFSVILNEEDAKEMSIAGQDRVRLKTDKSSIIGIVLTSKQSVDRGEIGIFTKTWEKMKLNGDDKITVTPTTKPESVEIIKKKMDGLELTTEEIHTLIRDISDHALSNIELTAYVTALYINGMNLRETADLTKSMVEFGDSIDFDRPVYDLHSIGGLPGNTITLIVVPIVAAAGLLIPKTSSRAISSACGTADIVEVFMNATFTANELSAIAEKTNGTMAWGGGISMAPADDIIIKVEYPLGIDPHPQMLASIMSKKKATGVDFLAIDIPVGPETKIKTVEEGVKFANEFVELGKLLDIKVECAISYGDQPMGRAIGPAVETIEVIKILEGSDYPRSMVEKSCEMAGMILEMAGMREGTKRAYEILKSGKAFKKFQEIVEAQGGIKDITSDKIKLGKYKQEIYASKNGYLKKASNRAFVKIVRAAGSPRDHGAGVILNKKLGQAVLKGELLYTIYADSEHKLKHAVELSRKLKPMRTEGIILDRVPSYSMLDRDKPSAWDYMDKDLLKSDDPENNKND